ncbi:MAG: 3-isopropylmalate dehydratase small subunit [Myxococcales bacterium]
MSQAPFTTLTSATVVLPQANIDTDQIIPARFLKTTTREGLREGLFADWRTDAAGNPRPEFPLNAPAARGAQVLVAGENFGCGSSREHAPWALVDAGFRAVVSSSIADIFRGNALKNGLLPVTVDAETHRFLLAHPGAKVAIDVAARTLSFDEGLRTASFPLDPFARHCLLNGVDELGFLLGQEEAIAAFERARGEAR